MSESKTFDNKIFRFCRTGRGDGRMSIYSTYYLEKGDEVPCMRCGNKFILRHEPPKCCRDKQDAAFNMCGCQGAPEPILCDKCWKELEE